MSASSRMVFRGRKFLSCNIAKTNKLTVLGNGSVYTPPCLTLKTDDSVYWFNATTCGTMNYKSLPKSHKQPFGGLFVTSLQWQRSVEGLSLFLSFINQNKNYTKQTLIFGPPGNKSLVEEFMHKITSQHSRDWLSFIRFVDVHDNLKGSINNLDFEIIPLKSTNNFSTLAYITNTKNETYKCSLKNIHENKLYHPEYVDTIIEENIQVVLECPTENHLESLINSTRFNAFKQEKTPSIICHITPDSIFNTTHYQAWMNSFGDACQHLLLNDQNLPGVINGGVYEHQLLLHKGNDYFFPHPYSSSDKEDYSTNIIRPPNLLLCDLSGTHVQWDKQFVQNSKQIAAEVEEKLRFLSVDEHKNLSDLKAKFIEVLPKNKIYPQIIHLGTGSNQSLKRRVNSAHLVLLDDKSSILMDCGDFTLQQVYLHFGEKTKAVLNSIKMIFISHFHYDHHMGFIALLKGIKAHGSNKKNIFCLHGQKTYYEYMKKYEPELLQMVSMHYTNDAIFHDKFITKRISNLANIAVAPVDHFIYNKGLIVKHSNGFKLAYTSDTRPLPIRFAHAAMNSDLLIHDCLSGAFKDMVLHGYDKKRVKALGHSDYFGALQTFKATNSKFLLLTHAGSKNPIIPICEKYLEENNNNCAFAMDHASIFSNEYHLLPLALQMLHIIFKRKQLEIVLLKKNSNNS